MKAMKASSNFQEGTKMRGLRIVLPAMAILGLLALAGQAGASPVTITFQITGTSSQVRYINVYADTGGGCLVSPQLGTCTITVPSQGRHRFRYNFDQQNDGEHAQNIEFWADIPNTGTTTLDIPVHDVTFTRQSGCYPTDIWATSSTSVTYGQEISGPNNRLPLAVSVGYVGSGANASTTVPMLDGCYTITTSTHGNCPGTSACKTIVGPPLCVGGDNDQNYDFDAPCL
jgi:hypothetical protein